MTQGKLLTLVDGEESGVVPATDSSVLRGDGCFEAVRAYGGRLFRLDDHLARLERSAEALEMPPPKREDVERWMSWVAEEAGDCVVRVVLTRGSAVPGWEAAGKCVVVAHPVPPATAGMTLWPVPAPWHPAGRRWDLAGAKTISYAPNLAATRTAQRHGADDALLIADDQTVLEGPTFSVGWCRDGTVYVPPLELGVLDSITRRVVVEIWPEIVEERIDLGELEDMGEIFVMSTVREVTPVTALGGKEFEPGPLVGLLAQRFAALVAQ